MIALEKTRQTRVLYIFSIIAIGALVVLFLRFRLIVAPINNPLSSYDTTVLIGKTQIFVSLADTQEEQERGLSGTAQLNRNTGKLFVFKDIGRYGFWMKDMNYALDIIWIDENLRISSISEDVLPETYPTVFYPPSPVKYVLEVNAGFSTEHNLSLNQLVTISNNLSF